VLVCKYTQTPIPFWINMPLSEFVRWIKINNDLILEEKEQIEQEKNKHSKRR